MFRQEIVVVGGGTAGWMTAIHIKRIMGVDYKVTLIESEEIGILGAGEGTTPAVFGFLRDNGIDRDEFIRETNATFKIGISFENWNGVGTKYFHPFNSPHHSLDFTKDLDKDFVYPEYMGYLRKNGINLDDYEISCYAAKNNWSPILKEKVNDLDRYTNYAYHFDAHLVAKYLRKIGERKGVKRVEGKVNNFEQNEKGEVKKIVLEGGHKISADLIFDCSGFQRLLIGNLYKSPWKSYMNHLKVNTAIPFQLKHTSDEIFPYTRAIAMKNGWMWQIPLQNRIGAGYVFDNNYTTVEEAKKEVEEFLGHEIDVIKEINFSAGVYEKVWIKNVIAVGLSMGFTEPIEATSIFNALNQLYFLNKNYLEVFMRTKDEKLAEDYNRQTLQMNDAVLDFLYAHYITKREDTPFWKEYLKTTQMPEKMKKTMEEWKIRPLNFGDFYNNPFHIHSWLSVGMGLDFFNNDLFLEHYEKSDKQKIENHHQSLIHQAKEVEKNVFKHREFLNKIKNDKISYI
jgi:tryptophan 7-halogenase